MPDTETTQWIRTLVFEEGVVREIPVIEAGRLGGRGFVWLHVEGAGRDGRPELPGYVHNLAANALFASETRPRCDEIDKAALINLRGDALQPTRQSD